MCVCVCVCMYIYEYVIETVAMYLHCPRRLASALRLEAGDDAGKVIFICIYIYINGSANKRNRCRVHIRMDASVRTVLSLAFTRYSFTPKLSCTSQSFLYCPFHLHCPDYCNTIARLMRNIQPPPDPLVYAVHHTTLVVAISCKGQFFLYVCICTNIQANRAHRGAVCRSANGNKAVEYMRMYRKVGP